MEIASGNERRRHAYRRILRAADVVITENTDMAARLREIEPAISDLRVYKQPGYHPDNSSDLLRPRPPEYRDRRVLPMAAMAFRRGLVLMLLVFILPVPQQAYAFSWDDLWKTRDQQAQELLEEGRAEDAARLFEDPRWRAVANYRSGEYSGSAAGFASAEDVESLYNLGNALARLGEFESAIDAYEEVIAMNPDAADAIYNRDLLKDMLEQNQDSQNGEQGNQDNASESGGGAQQSEGQSQSEQTGDESSGGDPGAEGQDGEQSVRDEENVNQEDLEALQEELERAAQEAQQSGEPQEQQGMSEAEAEQMRRAQEQQQAMEQWLRRIPDDPGGLLRRKFRYQYQRQGKDQDGNNLWPDDEVQPW
jgi:Ca-activated chloride channel family protein